MMFRKNDNKYKKVGNHATNFPKCCTFVGVILLTDKGIISR